MQLLPETSTAKSCSQKPGAVKIDSRTPKTTSSTWPALLSKPSRTFQVLHLTRTVRILMVNQRTPSPANPKETTRTTKATNSLPTTSKETVGTVETSRATHTATSTLKLRGRSSQAFPVCLRTSSIRRWVSRARISRATTSAKVINVRSFK